ncbi:PAS domain S-box protein [Lysobacter sp. S4-A87]|uniref:ATP-binding protein n=1 Tax=Lysobacter sp. S4-A87 TaxID=2925843 RepID=UPI001F53E0FA|nr:ATP-binding protein [Lysobacter sp. S4-A87]UNK49821.1 PAS domain S-box protein [Lysobacter sp. S4-A87]
MSQGSLLAQLFEIVPDALILVDDGGKVVQANANAERLFGFATGRLLGLEVEALMPMASRHRHGLHRQDYMASPRIRQMGETGQSLIGQRLDGQQFPVEIALSPVDTEHGTRYLASIRDVSESQRARQAIIRARYDALVARIGHLALESTDENQLIQTLPPLLAAELDVDVVAMALIGLDGMITEVPASFGTEPEVIRTWTARQWSAISQELLGDRPMFLRDVSLLAEDEAFAEGALIPLLGRDRPAGVLIGLSRRPNGLDHDALHLLQSSANLLAALMQRRRTEEELAHAQRLDAIGQLTGGVAHDFNNLLTVMSGCLQLLEIECQDRPGAQDLIAGGLRSVSRGAELTTKLLAFARRQHLTPGGVVPHSLLQGLGTMLQRTLGDMVRLTIDCPDSVPAAYADVAHLETALVNLVLNARDALPAGGDITLSAQERWVTAGDGLPDMAPGHYVVFCVEDNGIGMSAETLARAIDPFFTTKDSGRGSGLGLSMVYGFARQSNGYLGIDSQPGRGTAVAIYLPVARSADSPAAPARPSLRGDGETVLVVEDESDVRAVAIAFLQSLGYRPLSADSATQAMAVLSENPDISLLFSDVILGNGMNGYALAQWAKSRHPGLRVLMTSGYDESADAVDADLRDRFELLRKPYRREGLAEAIRTCLW